jgi:hypothetical protein
MMTRDNLSTATVRDEDKPKAPAFHQANAADNPIDEHGKTKRDYEIEEVQKAAQGSRQAGAPIGKQASAPVSPDETLGDGKSEAQNAAESEFTGFDGPEDGGDGLVGQGKSE